MKTKLLRKIRKRYQWYFNKDGYPVLLDMMEETAKLYDLEYCVSFHKYKMEDLPNLIKVSYTEWALRHLKMDILSQHGWSMKRVNFRLASRHLKQRRAI